MHHMMSFKICDPTEREEGRRNGSFSVAENSEALETEGFLKFCHAKFCKDHKIRDSVEKRFVATN